jgi:hypothetical protein
VVGHIDELGEVCLHFRDINFHKVYLNYRSL